MLKGRGSSVTELRRLINTSVGHQCRSPELRRLIDSGLELCSHVCSNEEAMSSVGRQCQLAWFGLVYRGLTPQQQPGSYQGGEMMMMKSVSVGNIENAHSCTNPY